MYLADGTELEIQFYEGFTSVTAVGTAHGLSEVGQQIAWLGAALQSPLPESVGLSTCLPVIKSISSITSPGSLYLHEILCHVSSTRPIPVDDEEIVTGACWHHMFLNPIIVGGYPVLAKSSGLGVEMPLNMMAQLAGTDRAVEFDGNIFLKGFSTMLVVTKVLEDLLVWHYHYNRQGNRLSYLDHDHSNVDSIGLHKLQTARHVVGWCANHEYYTG